MAKVSGLVFKIYPKFFPASDGKKATTFYSIKLDGDPKYYRCKTERYAGVAEAGNVVEFEISGGDDKSADVVKGTVKLVPQIAPQDRAPGSTKAVDWAAKDAAIQYQSARNAALEYVQIMTKLEAIKLPAKPADRLAVLDALLDRLTAGFYEDVSSFGAVARVKGTATATETEGPPFDEDE